jgi:hypothetical protein
MGTRSRKATYRSRFVGRQLELAVGRLVDEGKFTSEAEVARWLERDPSTFNRWVNGFSHPRTDEDWRLLTRLGVNSGFLRRLELLDKLDAWRADMDMTVEELVTLAVQVQNQKHGGVIFRVDPGRREEQETGFREEIA